MSEVPSFIRQQEAFDEVGRELYGMLVDGDESIYFTGSYLGPTGENQYWAVRHDGQFEMSKGRANSLSSGGNFVLSNAIERLREACYIEGKGTWFGIAATVMPDGSATVEYNYETEPGWQSPIEPTLYVREQEMFPRDLEHQPEWFQRRLAEGQAALEEYRRDPKGYYDRM